MLCRPPFAATGDDPARASLTRVDSPCRRSHAETQGIAGRLRRYFSSSSIAARSSRSSCSVAAMRERENSLTDRPWTISYLPFAQVRSEEHTSELQSLMRISYAVFCLKKKKQTQQQEQTCSTYR